MRVEELFHAIAGWIALGVEAAAAILIAIGAIEALARTLPTAIGWRATLGEKRLAWQHFARWLVLALEFELAADILRSAISPSWDAIGQLGAIAVIRTFLSYFLSQDMAEARETTETRSATNADARV